MAGNGFFAKVHALVAQIPPGKVMTYGQIAALLGDVCSAKVVGYAMRAVPEGHSLPCHRVINKAGGMAGGLLFGGPERQRQMLEEEGVPFTPEGRVDLAQARYQPD